MHVAGAQLCVIGRPRPLAVLALLAAGVVAVVVRYRPGERRSSAQQLKWILAAFFVVMIALGVVGDASSRREIWFAILDASARSRLQIAIFRYRLYGYNRRDHPAGRSCTRRPSVGSLALIYPPLAGITLIERLLQAATGPSRARSSVIDLDPSRSPPPSSRCESPASSAPSTTASTPRAPRRPRESQTLNAFTARLPANQIDLDSLQREVLGAVQTTVQPRHASLWLRRSSDHSGQPGAGGAVSGPTSR